MTTICLTFHIHNPYHLKQYRFFDIGINHAYYDLFSNKTCTENFVVSTLLPSNQFLLDLIKKYPDSFHINFAISGLSLSQLNEFSPEAIKSFRELAQTGNVEFLGGTYSHSLASLYSKTEFDRQVNDHSETLKKILGVSPSSFYNTELIYTDEIGEWVHDLGFKTIITENSETLLGWKSPNHYYSHPNKEALKIAIRNSEVSENIINRFVDKNWIDKPTSEIDIVRWVDQLPIENEAIHINVPYQILGGIYFKEKHDLLSELLELMAGMNIDFCTLSDAANKFTAKSSIHTKQAVASIGDLKNISSITNNALQTEALEKLYQLEPFVLKLDDPLLLNDWQKLQAYDHFYWMEENHFRKVNSKLATPYQNAYEAFINYMNILNDFALRIGANSSISADDELHFLRKEGEIRKQKKEITYYKKQLKNIRKTTVKLQKQATKRK